MTTFITPLHAPGTGVRLAVKDLIDVAGVPTTAGCKAVADEAAPAESDAACLAGARAAGARIVGKTNLHELAFGVTGENPWYGTPVNPLDPGLVPGGSSSGSAVAVASGEADVAFGSDTGGSVRIPSACCATAGLKTTHGRISLDGVFPLATRFDTVGPMARDVAGLELGMALLEPGFAVAPTRAWRVGRLRPEVDPLLDLAVDAALGAVGWEVVELRLDEWDAATAAAGVLLVAEAWATHGALTERAPDRVGADVVARMRFGRTIDTAALLSAEEVCKRWRSRLNRWFAQVDFLATSTLAIFPPPLGSGEELLMARCTLPVNLAGVPALALPVPSPGPVPASLQLIGPTNGEEQLLAAGRDLEAATT